MVIFTHPKYGTKIRYFDRMSIEECTAIMEELTLFGFEADTSRLYK